MLASICMIVRNEEDILGRAIESTKGLADEIVVLDTGSEDGTVRLAESLGAKVLVGGDRMHKGQSRNRVMAETLGDWVVILDADERIADPTGLRAFLESTTAQALFIKLAYVDDNGNSTLSFSQMRCWRRGTYQYKYRAHEVPLPTDGWGERVYTNFVWEHRPPPDRVWKSDYTLARLLLDVTENPNDARQIYYLGRQYMYRKEWEKAIEYLQEYLERPGRDEGDAWHCLSICHSGLGDEKARIKALYQACAADTGRREWWCELAGIYHDGGKDNIALGLLKCALEQPMPERGYVRHGWYGATIYDLTARCLWKLGRYEEGLGFAQTAINLSPSDERLQRNLLWFEAQLGDMDAFYELHGPEIHSRGARHTAIADLVEGPNVLDAGCGTGDLLLLLQKQDSIMTLVGTDISNVALDMARKRGVKAELHCSDSLPTPLQFDTIVLSQVLEHLDDDEAMIRMAAWSLKPGGLLIVSVPRGNAVPSPDHRREYTEESLRGLLEGIGEPLLHSWPGEQLRLLMAVRKRKHECT